MSSHPCLACGACCAFYRVSFYWTEADPFSGGTIPAELTRQLTPHRIAMKGTSGKPPNSRCVALTGKIGEQVACNIYSVRGSTCREFIPSWEDGEHNEACDKARAFYNLPPLTPEDFSSPGEPEPEPDLKPGPEQPPLQETA